ncbi:MAG: DUF4177 domain-containing protein [Treponema sp.]|nr:DUF4177 domain-containing protein [Treponema sp.]
MEQWEYKVLNFVSSAMAERGEGLDHEQCEQILNELGKTGWELTGVVDWGAMRVFLKRRK